MGTKKGATRKTARKAYKGKTAQCKKISYVTKSGKRITYYRKVKILASGKWRFVKGKCNNVSKRIKRKKKR